MLITKYWAGTQSTLIRNDYLFLVFLLKWLPSMDLICMAMVNTALYSSHKVWHLLAVEGMKSIHTLWIPLHLPALPQPNHCSLNTGEELIFVKKLFFTFFTFAPAISVQAEMSVLCCNQVGAGFKTGYNLESPTGGWDHNYARLVISGFRLNTIWAKQLCCHNPSILLSSGFFISALNQHHCGSGNIWNTIYSVHATRFHPHWLRRMNWQEAGAVTWLIIITQLNFDSF